MVDQKGPAGRLRVAEIHRALALDLSAVRDAARTGAHGALHLGGVTGERLLDGLPERLFVDGVDQDIAGRIIDTSSENTHEERLTTSILRRKVD